MPKRPSRGGQYLVSLKSSAAPTPTYEGFVDYMAEVDIQLSPRSSRKAWSQIKQFFSSDSEDLSIYESLVDVQSLTAAFREASEFGSSGSVFSPAVAMPPPPPLPQMIRIAVSSSSTAPASRTPSRSPRSTVSKSISSRSKAVPGQILTIKGLFKRNFDGFGGSSWVLLSGAIVDDRLLEVVEALPRESALHSFIVEDVDALLALSDDVKDKEEITRIMTTRQDEKVPGLSQAELNFIKLLRRIWMCFSTPTAVRASATFSKTNRQQSSGNPGEISSESSARRRRKQVDWEDREQVDHKVDGVVVVGALPVEICWMVAAKRDGGLNTTKSLHDTLKLAKLMKDGVWLWHGAEVSGGTPEEIKFRGDRPSAAAEKLKKE
ncbi:hypothetical protein DFQ27_000539, partial [Actinomortierella ambigua]